MTSKRIYFQDGVSSKSFKDFLCLSVFKIHKKEINHYLTK